jgi:hypothetical protein
MKPNCQYHPVIPNFTNHTCKWFSYGLTELRFKALESAMEKILEKDSKCMPGLAKAQKASQVVPYTTCYIGLSKRPWDL